MGYYMDFGVVKDLVNALEAGFVYSWQYSLYQKKNGCWEKIFDFLDEVGGGSGSSLSGIMLGGGS